MFLISNISTLKLVKGQIRFRLPAYHRFVTGLRSGTKYYVIPIITAKNGIKEAIITSIPPHEWKNIFKVEVTAEDRKGLIRDITRILKDLRINIFYHDYMTTRLHGKCRFQLMLDISKAHRLPEMKDEASMLNFIETEVQAPLKKVNEYNESNEFTYDVINRNVEVKYEKNVFLNGSFLQDDAESRMPDMFRDRLLYNRLKPHEISKKEICLDEDLLGFLGLTHLKEVQCITISDSEERFIRIQFFNPDQKIVSMDIKHENLPGSIYAFSDYILRSGHDDLNILACFNRLEDSKSVSHWHAMVDISDHVHVLPDFEDINRWNEHIKNIAVDTKVYDVTLRCTKNLYHEHRRETAGIIKANIKRNFLAVLKKYARDIFYLFIIFGLVACFGIKLNWFTIGELVQSIKWFLGSAAAVLYVLYQLVVAYHLVEFSMKLRFMRRG